MYFCAYDVFNPFFRPRRYYGLLLDYDSSLDFNAALEDKVNCVTVALADVVNDLFSDVGLFIEKRAHILAEVVGHGFDEWYFHQHRLPFGSLCHALVVENLCEVLLA